MYVCRNRKGGGLESTAQVGNCVLFDTWCPWVCVCVYMCILCLRVRLCVHTRGRLGRGRGNGCGAFWLRSALVSSQETSFCSSEGQKMTLINNRLERNAVFLPSSSLSSNLSHFSPLIILLVGTELLNPPVRNGNNHANFLFSDLWPFYHDSIVLASSLAGWNGCKSAYRCVLLPEERTVNVLWGSALHPSHLLSAPQWLQHHGHWATITKIMWGCSQKLLDSQIPKSSVLIQTPRSTCRGKSSAQHQ